LGKKGPTGPEKRARKLEKKRDRWGVLPHYGIKDGTGTGERDPPGHPHRRTRRKEPTSHSTSNIGNVFTMLTKKKKKKRGKGGGGRKGGQNEYRLQGGGAKVMDP